MVLVAEDQVNMFYAMADLFFGLQGSGEQRFSFGPEGIISLSAISICPKGPKYHADIIGRAARRALPRP